MVCRQEKVLNINMEKIQHIGLQIIEKDLVSFYKNVLGCILSKEFALSEEDTFSIFKISKDVRIIYAQCENIEFELFIDNHIKPPSFNHVCISMSNALEVFKKAEKNGFHAYIREKNNKTQTYFIGDSNHNIFEIKNTS